MSLLWKTIYLCEDRHICLYLQKLSLKVGVLNRWNNISECPYPLQVFEEPVRYYSGCGYKKRLTHHAPAFFAPCTGLFLPDVDDFADVHVVDAEAVALVPLALLGRHQVRIELLAVDFAALDGEVSFRVDGVAQFREFDGEAGAGHLVLIPSGDAAQVGKLVPHGFGEVCDREVVVLFHELVRVAGGSA